MPNVKILVLELFANVPEALQVCKKSYIISLCEITLISQFENWYFNLIGDPFVRCNDNPCSQDPCGQNADCEAQGARAVCRCR